ncbi:polyketide synthase dehydratase domain-containing protein, partial [Planomonospora alba]|uniref:polyketide synthase dehydratase domain-containing protein n=1 Tax=Planomonospora alba TaxID=161354 RepID=UPI0031E4EEB9
GVSRFVELGPDAVLSAVGAGCVRGEGAVFVPVLRRERDEARELLAAVARLHVTGVSPDWRVLLGEARRVELPTYAFQHRRFWLEAPAVQGEVSGLGQVAAEHALLSAAVALPGGDGPGSDGVVLTGRLSVQSHPWLADHVISGVAMLPGTAFVELAIRAGDEVGCALLDELTLEAPLVLPEHGGVALLVVVEAGDEDGRRLVEVYSRPTDATAEEPWTRHASGVLAPDESPAADAMAIWPPKGARSVDIDGAYERLAEQGYLYGPVFQGLKAVWERGEEVFAEVALPEGTSVDGFGLHPALLDAALHATLVGGDGTEETQLPFAWTRVSLHAAGASALRVRIDRSGTSSSIQVSDGTGRPVASVGSLVSRPVAAERLRVAGKADSLYRVDWWPFAGGTSGATAPWAVVGEDVFGLGGMPGVTGVYADFAALRAATGPETASAPGSPQGTAVPETVLLPVPAGVTGVAAGEVPGAVRAVADRVLGLVQEWLAEERFAA